MNLRLLKNGKEYKQWKQDIYYPINALPIKYPAIVVWRVEKGILSPTYIEYEYIYQEDFK
jgi:hypothetical protein